MGSAIALRLAQRGVGVTVIERGIPGAEASSAAAGILGPQMEAEGPGPLLDLGLRSRALYPALAAELREATGIDVGYDRSGVLAVALDDAGEAELASRHAWQLARGLRVERLSGDAARSREPALGPEVRAALAFPDEGQVNARELARAFSQAAAGAGARFLSGRYVRRVIAENGVAVGVELDGESCPRVRWSSPPGAGRGWSRGRGCPRPSFAPRAASWCRSRRGRRSSATSSPSTAAATSSPGATAACSPGAPWRWRASASR